MANFQFRIVTGVDEAACKTKYDSYASPFTNQHDPYTFYLFDKGGIGYLGDTPLFGGDASKFNMLSSNTTLASLKPSSFYFIQANCTITDDSDPLNPVNYYPKAGNIWVTDGNSPFSISDLSLVSFNNYMAGYITNHAIHASNIDAAFTGSENNIATTAAIEAMITRAINGQAILGISFFRACHVVTITAADINSDPTNPYVTFVIGKDALNNPITATAPISVSDDHEGDIGMVFQIQVGNTYDETENDGDRWIFVNLHGLINVYIGGTSDTTTTTVANDSTDLTGHRKKITVEVNKSAETQSSFNTKILNAINNSLSNGGTYEPTSVTGDNLSPNKFISESQLADILSHLLVNFVQYSVD